MSEETEIPLDIKNDIELAFNLYKNENNKINKLKLRTLLFSFVMYKYSASEINEFIESRTLKEKELYSFDDVCDLVKEKLLESKERDSEELYNYILNNKTQNKQKKDKEKPKKVTKSILSSAFESSNIDIEEKEIEQMLEYMKRKQIEETDEAEIEQQPEENEKEKNNDKKKETSITMSQFRQFYVEQK